MTREDCIRYANERRHPDHARRVRSCTRSTTTSGAAPSSAARWRTRGRRRRRACGRSRSRRRPSRATSRSPSSRACRWPSTARRSGLVELIERVGAIVGSYGVGPARHGREPPGRHQEPRDLRVPVGPRPHRGPPGPRVDLPRARPRPGEAAPRDPLRRARLRRPVVQPAASRRSTPSSPRRSATSPARCACTSSPGSCIVDRPPQPVLALRLRASPPTTPPTASATPTPPASCACGACRSSGGRRSRDPGPS